LYRKFLTARSPLRLLEKGLHGGLGPGNVGVVIAGHGVGKRAFLVGVALDELLRGGRVLHACLDDAVAHVRAHYDTVFEDLAATTHLEDEALVHGEIDRRRIIHAHPSKGLTPGKLRDDVKVEIEADSAPNLLVIEGLDWKGASREDLADLKALAGELNAELWLSATLEEERVDGIPSEVQRFDDLVSVVLALEPEDDAVRLRALKDHENPDLAALHVALDPRTLLLIRN
jgi:hypothetical protein